MDEAIHHRGTDFGLVFCDLSESLLPIDMEAGECSAKVVITQGGPTGPVVAQADGDMTWADMGVWSVVFAAEDAQDWPDDVLVATAIYSPAGRPEFREVKAIIHPERGA